jgi:hypothetical protein
VVISGTVPALHHVVIDYGMRLGEFDIVDDPRITLEYTSASGAGAGQVIIHTPEPAVFTAGIFAFVALVARRRERLRLSNAR